MGARSEPGPGRGGRRAYASVCRAPGLRIWTLNTHIQAGVTRAHWVRARADAPAQQKRIFRARVAGKGVGAGKSRWHWAGAEGSPDGSAAGSSRSRRPVRPSARVGGRGSCQKMHQ